MTVCFDNQDGELIQRASVCWTKGWFTSQAVQCEILSHCSELCAIENLGIIYFWNFPLNISGPQLTAGNKLWKVKPQIMDCYNLASEKME